METIFSWFPFMFLFPVLGFFLIGHFFFRSENQIRLSEVPMSPTHRQLLKDFIMKKEEAVLTSEDYSGKDQKDEILETGAVDCLYGLYSLYHKLLSIEQESKDAFVENVTAAGWLKALQQKDSQVMDHEETRIAQMLFDAADLDALHSITFTEFAMLAVLLSATDAHDADAQV
jgi:hypothetical protein